MALDIHIEKINDDGSKDEVAYFSGVHHIQDFYASRGLGDNQDQHIDVSSLHLLLDELQSKLAQAKKDVAQNTRLIDKLDTACDTLSYAIENNIKEDDELIYHCSR